MSDGDWWLASDGRWYPPEAKPGPLPPPEPPPPPIPTYVPTAWPPVGVNVYSDEPRPPGRALGGWLQGLCWASAGLFAVLSVLCIVTAVQFQTYWTSSGGRARGMALADWAEVEDATGGVFGLAITVVAHRCGAHDGVDEQGPLRDLPALAGTPQLDVRMGGRVDGSFRWPTW